MKITWDKNARAVYIYLDEANPAAVERTVRLSRNIFADYDCGGLQGIEVLNINELPLIEDITNIGVAG